MTRMFRCWLAVLMGTVLFCLLSVRWLDVVTMAVLGRHYLIYQQPLEIPIFILLALLPLGAVGLAMSGVHLLRGQRPPYQTQAFGLAGIAALGGLATTDLLFKPFFGRIGVDAFFFQPRRYGFAFFNGQIDSAFPSGHAVIAAAFLSVLGLLYPRWRAVHAGLGVLVMASLLASRWHFVSDVVAGAFIGWTAALVTIATWRRVGTRHDRNWKAANRA